MDIYTIIKKLISLGRTAGLSEKISVIYAVSDDLTEDQYTEIMGLLNPQPA